MAELKMCRFIAEAIVSEGIDKGEARRVCAEADCPIHHPKKQSTKADASFKAEQEKSRKAKPTYLPLVLLRTETVREISPYL